jgi:hypothetical protein
MIHSDFQPESGSNSLWITLWAGPDGDPQRLPAGKRQQLAVDQSVGRAGR